MSVHYKRLPAAISRDREQVSDEQYLLLTRLQEDGLHFNINEGHRTMARQAELVREQGLYNPVSNPHGAAAPSNVAPHIKTGSPAHALDVDPAQTVIDGARKHGVTYTRTVSTESWHIEPNPSQLAAFARRERTARAKLRRHVRSLRRRGHKLVKRGKAVLARARKLARR